ncbi:SANT/Myb domain [Macleaya cordata]|uniref:SANT/Myb domain n=1 Tax=Macleaya cordata TaxID=56857 RepID=A0A200QI43_MACCD|nr:SANT/Myb domain [Macleaya cordata]
MPPEPLPWDRKDFFKEKKHDRLDSIGSVSRWRDSHQGSREFSRWGPDDFRRPLGHGKQGGYQLFPEESGYGCTPSRSSERMVDDESNFRPFTSRGEGKYSRNNREVRGSISQKDWRGHLRETGDVSVNSSGRHHDLSAQRSVSDLITSHHSDIENSSCDQPHFKDEHDKMGSFDGLGTGHRYERDHSLGSITWNRVTWNRSSSLSSRGSGFSHSSSSRSMRADSDESKPELPPGGTTPVRSPLRDAAGGVTSTMNEETCPRKKQRLGWGQGLAKYEKQKVEGPDDNAKNPKTTQSIIPSSSDRSPRVTGLSECSSPPTPSSFACSSSPVLEDKPHTKDARNDNHTSNSSGSPSHGFQNFVEGFSVNLEHLELTPTSNLSCLLNDLLQPEDASSGDSNFVRSTAMNKLLLLKTEFLKAVEKTECEIDMFENELKLLKSEPDTGGPRPTASESLQVKFELKPCEVVGAVSKVLQKPAPLQLVSFDDLPMDKTILCDDAMREGQTEIEDDIDSPGTATSKFVEPSLMEKADFSSHIENHGGYFTGIEEVGSTSPEGKCSPSVDIKSAVEPCTGDVNLVNEMNAISHVSSDLKTPSHTEINLSESILASNRDFARSVSEIFTKLLPTDGPQIDRWEAVSVSCQQNNLLIKEKLMARKRFQRFKERVLTLKYRALQHMWKEDMHLLSIRKYRAKSHKRFESSLKILHNGHQKHRSSVRSRFTSPAGNLTLVPTTNIVDFTSKLLSDSQIKLHRSSLKMPALILDGKERRFSRFVTSNGLVEDPCSVEKERVMINPWTPAEKEVFLEMLATFGKDFKRIASFLDHKTTADCIEFYYKHHKSESFEKIKKKLEHRKQGRNIPTNTYLVTSGKKWNREANAVSLDVLGAASVIAAHTDDSVKTQQSSVGRSFLGRHCDYKASSGDFAIVGKSNSSDMIGNDREAVAADALAGIYGALSSEAVSSCITSSIDPMEGCQDWKFQKRNSLVDCPLTSDVMQKFDCQEACSDESCGELDSMDWTDEEKSIFIRAFKSYHKNFMKISRCIRTRSEDQCKIFFSKARKSLGLDFIQLGLGNEGALLSDDNGGRSDTEDACVLEMESAICSTQSCTKMDVDLPLSVANTNDIGSGRDSTTRIHTERRKLEESNGLETLDCEDSDQRKEVPDDCWAAVKPELTFDGDDNLVKITERKVNVTPDMLQFDDGMTEDATLSYDLPVQETKTVKEQGINRAISSHDESVCAGRPSGPGRPKSDSAVELNAVQGVFAEKPKSESTEGQVFCKSGCECRQDVKDGVDIDSSRSSSCCNVPDSKTNRHILVNGTTVSPGFSLTPNYHGQISGELVPLVQEAQVVSWQQKENYPSVSAKLSLRDSSTIHYQDHLGQSTQSSTLNFEDRQRQTSISADAYQPYLMGRNSLNGVESSQILRGYPLKVLNKKELNGDAESIICENHPVVQNISKVIRDSQSNQFLLQGLYHEKSNGLKAPRSLSELPLLAKGHEQTSSDHSRSHSRSSSDTEEHSRRFGDVKLFGKILSHPSPVQTSPIPTPHKTDSKMETPQLSSGKSSDLKLINGHGMDDGSLAAKLDTGNHSGLGEDYPMRSYGYWDGNRIQMGFSSLPDSAILFSNYPAAYSDFSGTSSCGDLQPQPLQTVIKRKDRNLGCVSVYPTKDISSANSSSRGLTDYHQVYRSYDGTKDVKRHDIFTELQKRNGCEKMSGFQQQQQGRGAVMVGMNVKGGGGILVGGGVSDPVAAIKMHYATTTERYGGTAGSMMREEESWRGGDIGSLAFVATPGKKGTGEPCLIYFTLLYKCPRKKEIFGGTEGSFARWVGWWGICGRDQIPDSNDDDDDGYGTSQRQLLGPWVCFGKDQSSHKTVERMRSVGWETSYPVNNAQHLHVYHLTKRE